MHRKLRAPAALVVLAMAAVLVPLASPASSVANVRTERIGGDNRYETAALIARSTFSSSTTAVLASGENFPDALAGSALAGARSAPVLLTAFSALPAPTRDALQTLQVKDVLILGGPAAVSDAVRNNLVAQGYNVSRIEGANRYATAAEVARRVALSGIGSLNGKRTAFLASGQNFPDALAAGPLANVGRHPVLLTPSASLAPETAAAIRDLQIQHVVILGGTFAVSDVVKAEIERQNVTTERLAGANRADTATVVANFALAQFGFEGVNVVLARGDGFADALAGGPNAGKSRAPILLTSTPNNLAAETSRWLSDHYATVALIRVLGGPGAVSDPVLNEAKLAAQTSNQQPSRIVLAAKASGDTGTDGGPKWQYQQTTKEMQLLATVTSNPPTGTTTQTSSTNPPVARQVVNFTVTPSQGDTGNSTLNLTATTDSNGLAKVTYTRTNPGFDTITATVRDNTQLTDKAEVAWGTAAKPLALTPDLDASLAAGTNRTFTVNYPAADFPSTGATVNLTALELLDADPTNDPNVGSFTFGGAATPDPDADHTLAKISVGPGSATATFTVKSSATTRATFMVFVDSTVNDNVDKTELRDKSGTTTWNAPGPTLVVTPDDAITVPNGQQRVYNVLATDAAGAPFVQTVDVGFVELTDRDPITGQPIAGTTTRGELAWYDNDADLAQTPLVDHQSPTGTTQLADNVTRVEVTPNPAGRFTFAITTDLSERFAPDSTGTPVVWIDKAGGQTHEREPNETQDQGGPTTWKAGARLNGTLESFGCIPNAAAPTEVIPEGTYGPCAPLEVAATSAPNLANAFNADASTRGVNSPAVAPRPPADPVPATPGAPAVAVTDDGSSRGDITFRFTNRDALGNPVVPASRAVLGGTSAALFVVQSNSVPVSCCDTFVTMATAPNRSQYTIPVPVGDPLFVAVPFIQGTPYAELIVDATEGQGVRVDVTQIIVSGTSLITGCGPLLGPSGTIGNPPSPFPSGISPIVDCTKDIKDTASWANVYIDTTAEDPDGTLLPPFRPSAGQPTQGPVPTSANCPAGAGTCFNGNVVTVDKIRKYYVLNTGLGNNTALGGNVYVVWDVGRGGEIYTANNAYGERRVNKDTYFVDGVQATPDTVIDGERCTNLIPTPLPPPAPPTPPQLGAGVAPAPGCARFEVAITPDDRIVYEPFSRLDSTGKRIFPQPGKGQRIQTHRVTNT